MSGYSITRKKYSQLFRGALDRLSFPETADESIIRIYSYDSLYITSLDHYSNIMIQRHYITIT